jgi:hypothetical protein
VKTLKHTLQKINWVLVATMIATLAIALLPLLPHGANAQLINQFNCPQGTGVRCQETDLPTLFRTIINYALGIAFFVAVIFLIYGGFLYITSGGNETTAKKGQQTVIYALIGIVIIVLSYVIVSVVYRFVSGTGAGP